MIKNISKIGALFVIFSSLISCQDATQPDSSTTDTQIPATATAISPDANIQTRAAQFQAHLTEIDDFSRDLINLMLDSHNRWQTLQVEVVGQWAHSNPERLQHTILIRQPYLARIIGPDYQATLGEDSTSQQQIDHTLQLLPTTLEEVEPITVYPHPLSALGLGFAGEHIFPTGLAQRGGRFELIAEETVLERPVWVVDWYALLNGNEKRNRYWIDQETGLILKSWGYSGGEVVEEIEFVSLVLDAPLADEAFPTKQPITGRTVTGRLVTGGEIQQPIPAIRLQLKPGGEFVGETIGDGRFILNGLSFDEITVYADHFQFIIPAGDEPHLNLGDIEYPSINPPLTLANYPPSDMPYHFENGSFWLVHTPEGQLMAFSPLPPEYKDGIRVAECQLVWVEANQRFTDPCSGDEWELNGRLNLEHSSELWSNRNLDQYHVHVMEGQIFVQVDRVYQGLPVNEAPLAADSQFGVTMTVKTAEFTLLSTSFTTLTQVDPIWGMDPTAFPPQQALSSVTFPNSLFDDQNRNYAPVAGQGELAVYDPDTTGLQQGYNTLWEPVAEDAQTVTATLTINLSNVSRGITFQPDLAAHQEGDVWPVDVPLEIGHAVARVTQLEWLGTAADGRIRLRLTVMDDSPDGIRLQCLYLGTAILERPACANFNNQQDYVVFVPAEAPATLHLWAGVELLRPFQFVLPVDGAEPTAIEEESSEPISEVGSTYTNQEYGFSMQVPPGWTVVDNQPHRVSLVKQGTAIALRFGVKQATDDINLVRSGVSAGDFVSREPVLFLGEPVVSEALVFLDKVKAIFYDRADEIFRGELIFVITLESNRFIYEDIDIPDDIQAEADAIIASVVCCAD